MNKLFFFLSCSMFFICMGCGSNEPNQVTSNGEWHSIFNGENLDGWKRLNGSAEFVVEDGVIVGTTKRGEPNTFLATERDYSDFALQFEFLLDTFINSGVQIRSNSLSDYQNGRVHGYQVELDPSSRQWTGGIYDESRRGWLYPMQLHPDGGGSTFKVGDWNKVYVEAVGDEIKTWVNDVPAAFLVDDFTDEGFIALQIHSVDRPELNGRKIMWRNIQVKTGNFDRKPGDFGYVVNTKPNSLTEAQRQMGWIELFSGQSTDAWRAAHATEFPSSGWKIEDGALMVEESGGEESAFGGDIVTKDEFSSFEFELEFMLSEGANSGIKYFVTEEYDQTEGSAIGLEYQLLDDEEHPDAKMGRDGNRTLGSLYDLMTAEKPARFLRPPGEWNHARIVVKKDNTVEHWLNYVKILKYKRGSSQFNSLVKESKYKDWQGFGLADQGHILLQDHGNHVKFRSIRVRNI